MLHVCGKLNRRKVRIWSTEHTRTVVKHVRDSLEVKAFFFTEPTASGINYLDMLQPWLVSQLQEESKHFIAQQDGDPPHFHLDVSAHLNADLPGRWIGRGYDSGSPLLPWHQRSPNLTPVILFLWGHIKDRVYVPLMPRDLPQLRQRIVVAVPVTDREILQRVW
jgi:hypothetical protein